MCLRQLDLALQTLEQASGVTHKGIQEACAFLSNELCPVGKDLRKRNRIESYKELLSLWKNANKGRSYADRSKVPALQCYTMVVRREYQEILRPCASPKG